MELKEGAALVGGAARRARAAGATGDADALKRRPPRGSAGPARRGGRARHVRGARRPDGPAPRSAPRRGASGEFEMVAARERARHGAWYELFPRSASPNPERHGTLRDVAALVPDIAELGFDVLYLPPIHPIGRTSRKGANNAATAGPDDPRESVGDRIGGRRPHRDPSRARDASTTSNISIAELKRHDMELALDLAFQCSPDHPWVREHPEWFRHRADGSIRFAENPPKKYEDIYPFDFETKDREGALERACATWSCSGSRRGADLPRGQPAHEAVRLLGVAARGGEEGPSRRPVPVGGLHPARA